MSRSKTYTPSQLYEAIQVSTSVAQVLTQLGLKPCGGNYKTINSYISENQIDISHFTGSAWCVGEKAKYLADSKRLSMEDILSGKCSYKSTFKLKNRLIKEGYFVHKCYNCGLEEWQGRPIPLELEHKNGNNADNHIDNLTLLCPNCHAQTKTYRGRNKKKKDVDVLDMV